MAKQYLFRIDILNKKDFNPLNIVAYHSGQIQLNAFNKEKFLPDPKKQVLYNNLIVPQDKLYDELPDYLKLNNKKKEIINNARNILWKNIDFFEKRIDSQFARRIEVYAPSFLSLTEVIQLVQTYSEQLASYGMVVDVAVHKTNTADNNILSNTSASPQCENTQDYCCFFLCTLRPFKDGIFQNKNREWNSPNQLVVWRHKWLDLLKEKILLNQDQRENKIQWENKLNSYPEFKKKPKI